MTKERKLAIEMWKGIRDMLSALDSPDGFSIQQYKQKLCEEHGLHWRYNCWFCQYMFGCSKCPFGDCDAHSDYDDVVNYRLDRGTRIKACNNIIKALGGEA